MFGQPLSQFFEIWFQTFGTTGLKVGQLLEQAPLRDISLRNASDPVDRRKISRRHLGRWLSRLTHGPVVNGWRMQSRKTSGQLVFFLAETTMRGPGSAPAVRPPGAALIKIAPGTHPQDALKEAITQGRQAVLEAMCSGDTLRMQDAQEFLKQVEIAAKHFLDSYEAQRRVEQAWKPTA